MGDALSVPFILSWLKRLLVLTCSHGRVSLENIPRGLIVA